jgi:uncharacterized membrane protein YeiH
VIVQTPLWLDLLTVAIAGITGALVAVSLRFDIVGVTALSFLTGLGGGIIRDVLLGQVPVAISTDDYVITAVAAAGVGFFFARWVQRFGLVLTMLDAASLGLFAVIGTSKALANGISTVPAVLVGVVTAVGGGALRDVFAGRPPEIFQPGKLYALAALGGVLAYVGLEHLDVRLAIATVVCVAVTFALRMAALQLDWTTPTAIDAPQVARRHARRHARRIERLRRRERGE